MRPQEKKSKMGSVVVTARRLLAISAATVALFGPSTAGAALTFTYNFEGVFANDANAQQAVVTAGNLFSNMFATYFTNTASLNFDVRGDTGVASAGTYAIVVPGFGTGEVVRNKILTGVDLNGADPDGFININLSAPFVLDPNAPVDFANGQIDFFSVLDHELTHALGFLSLGTTTGDQALSKFDQFLTTKAGVALYDPVSGIRDTIAFADALANGALFNGPNAVALYGSPVAIEGVVGDLSHLGTDPFTIPNVAVNGLMLCCGNPNSPDQSEPRDYNAAEVGIMADLGYTRVNDVPEPSSVLLMLAGLAGAAGFARRKGSAQPA